MIVVDTSALFSVLHKEGAAHVDLKRVLAEEPCLLSAGTLSELMIVAAGRGFVEDAIALIDDIEADVVPIDRDAALAVGAAYAKWGKGRHRASLNFGDCFAYALAKSRDLPLLYVGDDFALTDIRPALGQSA